MLGDFVSCLFSSADVLSLFLSFFFFAFSDWFITLISVSVLDFPFTLLTKVSTKQYTSIECRRIFYERAHFAELSNIFF